MQTIFKKMKRAGLVLNPPATETDVAGIEKNLRMEFPENLREIYLHHNGMAPALHWEYHTMPLDQLLYENRMVREGYLAGRLFDTLGVTLVWSNNNSDYVGICTREPFTGLIVFIEHDGTPFYFGYWSLEKFYQDQLQILKNLRKEESIENREETIPGMIWNRITRAKTESRVLERINQHLVEEGGRYRYPKDSIEYVTARNEGRLWSLYSERASWLESRCTDIRYLEKDFGRSGEYPSTEEYRDHQCARILLDLLQNEKDDDYRTIIFQLLCGILPISESDELIPFLDDNRLIQTAIESLVMRKWKPAIPFLEKHINNPGFFISHSVRRAILLINESTLQDFLEDARKTDFSKTDECEFFAQLCKAGGEVIIRNSPQGREEIRYRMPRSKEWKTFWKSEEKDESLKV